MKDRYKAIADGLYKISCVRRKKESPEAYLLCCMIAQIGDFLNSSIDQKRDDAKLYFNSEDFSKHCRVLQLHEDTVRRMMLKRPTR